MGAWDGGSWLGCGDLSAMGAVLYLGAGWPQWKQLGIPGPLLPIKRGSWLTEVPSVVQAMLHPFLENASKLYKPL